jgi:hypothetical protein
MRQDQAEIHKTLTTLFSEQETTIENKLNDNLQLIMEKIGQTTNSPTRKRTSSYNGPSLHTEASQTIQNTAESPPTTETTPPHHNMEYFNPYSKNSLRRRSVSEMPSTGTS